MTKPFLIVKTGGTFDEYAAKHEDFEHWTARRMGLAPGQWTCVDVRTGAILPKPGRFAGIAVTGSHDMVTDDLPWIETSARWLAEAAGAGLPIFGICFGHQLLAHALGGKAGYHPKGPEIGTVPITLTPKAGDDPLFSALPNPFAAHVTHSQSALELPPDAVLLAHSDHDAHQAFRVGECTWGVQFHPEFDADASRMYVLNQADKVKKMGQDPKQVEAAVRPTPESTGLLKAFARFCMER
ncbi:glutamine amidotransferase [Pseudodesulfovibrio sp.]|uniref:glutamine amidotransferase n=1 Tax=unclassified Pseudodesulfovibrio TaxID=2661612 RepID=UPI003B00F109